MEKQAAENILNKIVEGVNTAKAEIDELRVQLALGKAEVIDLFEISKKRFHVLLQDIESQIKELKKDKAVLSLINFLELLRIQLELGKAESKIAFEKQYTQLTVALNDLEEELRSHKLTNINSARLHLEIEKFRIKLNLFGLHYKLSKVRLLYDFDIKKNDLYAKLESIKDQILAKEKEGGKKWKHFQEEINEAYDHLKAAFKK